MAYIKTKEGRIYERQEKKDDKKYFLGTIEFAPAYPTDAYEIVAQSDKLEELFDEYILENKDHTYQSFLVDSDNIKHPISYSFTKDLKNGWLSYCSEYLKNGYKIYGATFVRGMHDEPILQPAAELTEKEGWVLL